MMLTLTASIMYWSLQQQVAESEDGEVPDESCVSPKEGENETALAGEVSSLAIDDSVSDTALSPHVKNEEIPKDNGSEEQSPKIEEKDGNE